MILKWAALCSCESGFLLVLQMVMGLQFSASWVEVKHSAARMSSPKTHCRCHREPGEGQDETLAGEASSLLLPLLSSAVQPRVRQAVFYHLLLCIATEHFGLLWDGVLILEGLTFLSGR